MYFPTIVAVAILAILVWLFLFDQMPIRRWLTKEAVVHKPEEAAILITGGASGIGRYVAETLARQNWTVVVTVRKIQDVEKIKEEGLMVPIMLDVTNEAHIEPALEEVKALLQKKSIRLAALINNAGINPEGDAMQSIKNQESVNEMADVGVAERVFATNVFGVARVTRAFLPLLQAHSGRILIIGSYFGSISGALKLPHIYYESSKFALEGMTDGLRRGSGIPVSLIKPGNIKTNMNDHGEDPPNVLMKPVLDGITSPHPQARYYAGRVKGLPAWLLCRLFAHLPECISDILVA